MSTGIGKSKASGIALMGKVLVGVMVVGAGMMPMGARAAASDAQFNQFMNDLCIVGSITPPPGVTWDVASLNLMCTNYQSAAAGPSGFAQSSNLGMTNAGGTTSSKKKKGGRISFESQSNKPEKGASADGTGWGLLITPQYGKSTRADTYLEHGYHSTLKGLAIGADYRFSDSSIIGVLFGQTNDEAILMNNSGASKSANSSATIYATEMFSEAFVLDGYLGYISNKYENRRTVEYGLISGLINGKTSGQQIMAGISASYHAKQGAVNLTPFANFDYIKTKINGFAETGGTLLEMRYSDRTAISSTTSLGFRLDGEHNYAWGAISPSVRLATVHEFQNKSKQIQNELVLTPGAGFQITTDSPDRNYLNLGLGVSASLSRGGQLFLDYEKRTQDKLLSSWAVSLGGLFEF